MKQLAGVTVPPASVLYVTVSSMPCGSDRHDCYGKLTRFASSRGMLYVPFGPGYTLEILSGLRARANL